ncbi:MAG: S9 family peptidase [Saprospiraceae bacterium]|nr:S9 family peptidase [Saprospiraceae bacterium]
MRRSIILLLFITGFIHGSTYTQNNITLEKIWKNREFSNKRVPGFNFMKDGRHYSRLSDNKILKYDLLNGEMVAELLNGQTLKDKAGFNGTIRNYRFNNDESKIIIESESESIYRRSSKAYFHIYDIKSQVLQAVYEEDKVMYATLSPDGSKVAYVWNNNLYFLDLESEITTPITFDGKFNEIINGSADWVYEEEFSFAKAFFWSPDSKKIAFMRFDETEVPEFTMTNYTNDVYPEYVTFKYPKVGEKNALVSIHIYDIQNDKTLIADTNPGHEHYIPRIKWTKKENTLMIYRMNRHQNKLELLLADANNGATSVIVEENNEYYIDITDDIRFLENGDQFIWSSEKSGFNHLYLYNLEGREMRALTSGDFDVTRFYGVDEKNKRIYYQAAETSPMERQIYSVNLRGKDKVILTPQKGYNSAQFSSTFDFFVCTHSTINQAPSYKVYDRKMNPVRVIEDNQELMKKASDVNVQNVEFFKFTTSENVELNGWMIKPDNFDPAIKYPVLMYVYGGPGSQQVTDSWKGYNYWWYQMLAKQGYVVACVDNRGTGGRGEEFKKMTYKNLGHYETIDQIEAASYLGSLGYTDQSRIGIFGWSYGGYMSSLCLFKGNEVFKAAIAVAPVTNWKWYDTIYTERFMRTEEENPDGYADNSPVNFVHKLKGNYLLVHGNADDNVHFQNTAEMANALISSNKQFDTYFYPNRNHGIYGDNARLHLYTKMTNFLNDKLKHGKLDNEVVNRP